MIHDSPAEPMSAGLNVRLSLMMFLQYAIWGAWLPIFWPYLAGHRGFDAGQIGNLFAIGAVGAIVAPFIAGQIADRWFSTERFLALSHLLGAALVWQLAQIETYEGFCVFTLLYSLIYSPTLSLTNSLAFHHLPDRDR
ncbi:MAG: MFS transporter, partial [Phycisphaerales bacterium]|nr:MFS transporter [Phycisphaerales bacterium]